MDKKLWGLGLLGLAVGIAAWLAAKASAGPKPGEPGGPPKTSEDAPKSPSGAVFGEITSPASLSQVDVAYFGVRSWRLQARFWNTNPQAPVFFTPVVKTEWDGGVANDAIALPPVSLDPGGAKVVDADIPVGVAPAIFGHRRAVASLFARITTGNEPFPKEVFLDSVFFTTY